MKRWQFLVLVVTLPLMLLGVVWQTGRHAALVAEARELERQQEAWVEANAKLQGGIAVLENRERAAELATRLGLERATANRRLFIDLQTAASPRPATVAKPFDSSAAAAEAATAPGNGNG